VIKRYPTTAEFLENNEEDVKQIIRFITKIFDNADITDDLYQIVAVKMISYKSIERYKSGRGSFKTWVWTIISNVLAGDAKHNATQPETVRVEPGTFRTECIIYADKESCPENEILLKIDMARYSKLLISTTPRGKSRRIIRLVLMGKNNKEIASAVKCSPQYVNTQKTAVRIRINRYLEKREEL